MRQFHPFTRFVIWFALALLLLYVGFYLFLILPMVLIDKRLLVDQRNDLDRDAKAFLQRHRWGPYYRVPCGGIEASRLQINLTAPQLHELAAEFHLHRPKREELMESNAFERQFGRGPAQFTDQDLYNNCSVCTYTRQSVVLLPVPDADGSTRPLPLTPHGDLYVTRAYWDPKTRDTCIDLQMQRSS